LKVEAGEGAGNLDPTKVLAAGKRQLDKVGTGTAAVIDLADPDLAAYQECLTSNIDSDGTRDSAVIGEQLGTLEVEAGEGAGNLVLSKVPIAAAQESGQ
jgi:hypothetical protein